MAVALCGCFERLAESPSAGVRALGKLLVADAGDARRLLVSQS
jgi:hypothetical protein